METGAIILAGGQSRRMGTNKALLRLSPNGPRLIELALAAVRPLVQSGVISANDQALYADLGWPVVADNFPGCGPLAGLEAGLSVLNTEYSLALACDMPYIKSQLLGYLLSQAAQANCQAVVPLDPAGRPEPLCAVYHRSGLPYIRASLEQGALRLTDWLAQIEVCYVPAQELTRFDPTLSSFRNLNTPQDMADPSKDLSE